jgi:hypothetical protein
LAVVAAPPIAARFAKGVAAATKGHRDRAGRAEIVAPNDVWAMDFMSDALFDGRPFRHFIVLAR